MFSRSLATFLSSFASQNVRLEEGLPARRQSC